MADLGEFKAYHDLVRFLDPLIREALRNLSDLHHDLLVRSYELPESELRSTKTKALHPNAQRISLFRARRAFSSELERLLHELPSESSADPRLFTALAVVKGEIALTDLETGWPTPASVECLSLKEFEKPSIFARSKS